jgi:CheY-like chemotaxis protein
MLPRKVMIVDDSEIVLAVAAHSLESAGYRVVTHPRPAGCIALILQESPDLLLIDVNMPGLNGDTVVKMFGSTQLKAPMVVLLHSSLPADVLAQKAAASGAHGFIRKTESSQEFIRQVGRWVKPGASSGTHTIGLAPRTDSQKMLAYQGPSAPPVTPETPAQPPAKILLVDNEMVELSEYRRLVASQPGPVEFALSGTEVLRRLNSEAPPDVVVLGRLAGSPNADELLHEATRLGSQAKTRFIVVHDSMDDVSPRCFSATLLRRPVTEAALCGAIRQCMRRAS